MLNILFAGTPVIASTILTRLLHTSHKIAAVYTQPEKPAGRGQHLTASPVKTIALEHHLPVFEPSRLRDPAVVAAIKALNVDVMVVVAYGHLIPPEILAVPRLGCINIHASLLPRWRGAAPVQRAILAGDTETGVSIMQMDAGLDTGAVLMQARCPIVDTDTSTDVFAKLAVLGADAVIATLDKLAAGAIVATAQDPDRVTYADKIRKEEAEIDWNLDAAVIARQIRAFIPWPVTFTVCAGRRLRVWGACVLEPPHPNPLPQQKALGERGSIRGGTILAITPAGIQVATGHGVLQITELQWADKRKVAVKDLCNAPGPLKVGTLLGSSI